jgi:hypothetical protein
MERSIEASATIGVACARARRVLLEDPGVVFTGHHAANRRRLAHYELDVSVGLGAGASVHQQVALELAASRSTETGLVQPLSWQATGRGRMLPRFDGTLELSPVRAGTCVRLVGTYTVPLGTVGRFGDGVIGHRLARRAMTELVERLAVHIEAEVVRRLGPDAAHPQDHSEMYVG